MGRGESHIPSLKKNWDYNALLIQEIKWLVFFNRPKSCFGWPNVLLLNQNFDISTYHFARCSNLLFGGPLKISQSKKMFTSNVVFAVFSKKFEVWFDKIKISDFPTKHFYAPNCPLMYSNVKCQYSYSFSLPFSSDSEIETLWWKKRKGKRSRFYVYTKFLFEILFASKIF